MSDLERSRRFYIDGLGFTEFARFEMERPIAEVDLPCSLTSYFIQKDGLRVELLDYRSPGVIGQPSTRRNHLGLTHLSFIVEDVDAAAMELEQYGGTIIEGTRSGQDEPRSVQIVFLADPDGTRVELMRLAEGQAW
ncbi:MAG: VOC family protein, partial [Actinobacteria bacterium]|nr:VOC family protein [Actinomycetota bacterium]